VVHDEVRIFPIYAIFKHKQVVSKSVVASWLVRSSPDRAVRVRTLAGDILVKTLYSHSASLHPDLSMGSGKFNAGDNPAKD